MTFYSENNSPEAACNKNNKVARNALKIM